MYQSLPHQFRYYQYLLEAHQSNSLISRISRLYIKLVCQVLIGRNRALDVGCGVGRLLQYCSSDSVGVDLNWFCVQYCLSQGLLAVQPSDLTNFSPDDPACPPKFEIVIYSHLLEHLQSQEIDECIRHYLPFLDIHGHLLIIVPQLNGYLRDSTHSTYIDRDFLDDLCSRHQLKIKRCFSSPFPALFGNYLYFNETIALATRTSC